MNLSLSMIVRNESEPLPRCLASVRSLVDEMVIVDTGSTDETVAIAQSFGARVYHAEWQDDFAAARNEALQHVNGKWILVLDADEEIAPDCVPALRQIMQHDETLVVNLVRQEIGAVQSPYSMVSRLFRQHPDLRFAHPYHASIDDSVLHIVQQEPQWRVVDLPDIAILHYGYAPGAIASRNKLEKARLSMERFLAQHPGDAYTCSKLGALYLQIDRINDGIELLEQGLKSGQPEAPVLYELHYHLGIAYSRLKHPAQAAQHYQLAIQQPIVERLKLGALNNLGSLRKATGDLTGAKQAFESALAIAPDFATAHNNLGMTLKALGKLPEAIAHYQQAIALNPDYADAQQNLGVALLKLGRVPESMAHFQQAIALHQQHNPPKAQRLREGLLQMGFQLS